MDRIKVLIRFLTAVEDLLVMSFCLLMLGAGIYGIYDSMLVYQQADDKTILQYKPDLEGASPEQKLEGNAVGWLTLDGTGIDLPIMQGADNFEYLNKNPYGEYSLAGSIFLDARNSSDFSDAYSLVYGHHMENGLMFGNLALYEEEKFFRENRTGSLIVEDREIPLLVAAVLKIPATDEVIFSPADRTVPEVIRKIQEYALLDRMEETEEPQKLLAFSTCREQAGIERTVVIAVCTD